MICDNCRRRFGRDSKYCNLCGTKLSATSPTEERGFLQNKVRVFLKPRILITVAGLLAIGVCIPLVLAATGGPVSKSNVAEFLVRQESLRPGLEDIGYPEFEISTSCTNFQLLSELVNQGETWSATAMRNHSENKLGYHFKQRIFTSERQSLDDLRVYLEAAAIDSSCQTDVGRYPNNEWRSYGNAQAISDVFRQTNLEGISIDLEVRECTFSCTTYNTRILFAYRGNIGMVFEYGAEAEDEGFDALESRVEEVLTRFSE